MALRPLFFRSSRAVKVRADAFESRIGALAKAVAGRFTRGSVAFQLGHVLTSEQLDRERDDLGKKLASK